MDGRAIITAGSIYLLLSQDLDLFHRVHAIHATDSVLVCATVYSEYIFLRHLHLYVLDLGLDLVLQHHTLTMHYHRPLVPTALPPAAIATSIYPFVRV